MVENAAIRRERRMDRLLTLRLMVQVVSWVMRGMNGEGEERRRCRPCTVQTSSRAKFACPVVDCLRPKKLGITHVLPISAVSHGHTCPGKVDS